jgi:hypothetical protein
MNTRVVERLAVSPDEAAAALGVSRDFDVTSTGPTAAGGRWWRMAGRGPADPTVI